MYGPPPGRMSPFHCSFLAAARAEVQARAHRCGSKAPSGSSFPAGFASGLVSIAARNRSSGFCQPLQSSIGLRL